MDIKPDINGPVQPVDSRSLTRSRATTPEEAAKQFEEILLRQLADVMTASLFKTSLSGEQEPGWMEGQRDTQRDVLSEVLARHLAESGVLGVSDVLMRQWRRSQPEAVPTTDTGSPRQVNESTTGGV